MSVKRYMYKCTFRYTRTGMEPGRVWNRVPDDFRVQFSLLSATLETSRPKGRASGLREILGPPDPTEGGKEEKINTVRGPPVSFLSPSDSLLTFTLSSRFFPPSLAPSTLSVKQDPFLFAYRSVHRSGALLTSGEWKGRRSPSTWALSRSWSRYLCPFLEIRTQNYRPTKQRYDVSPNYST